MNSEYAEKLKQKRFWNFAFSNSQDRVFNKKFLIVFFLFCILQSIVAETTATTVSWAQNGGVQKLYPTPMGYVYRFSNSSECGFLFKPIHKFSPTCKCLSCHFLEQKIDGGVLEVSLFKKKKQKHKRFVAIEFRIRAYPANSNHKTTNFSIQLLTSENEIDGANYSTLHSMLKMNNKFNSLDYSTITMRLEDSNDKKLLFLSPDTKVPFMPSFEPLSVRVVFDTLQRRLSVSYYDIIMPLKKVENVGNKSFSIRNIGIITTNAKGDKYRTEYLELSDPVIRQCDTEEEVNGFPKLEFLQYSYEKYPLENKKRKQKKDFFRELKKSKNSDQQYAAALKFLYGPNGICNPSKAIELLEDAAKKNHVLALYQLGLCYFRGYGVEPDIPKAMKYLKESNTYGYEDAGALSCFVCWDTGGRPFFATKKLNHIFNTFTTSQVSWRGHDPQFIKLLMHSAGSDTPVKSPKYLIDSIGICTWVNKNNPELFFVDYAIKSGYYPAYQSKARCLENNLIDQKLELLRAGVKAGDHTALPWLFHILAEKDLLSANEFTPNRDLEYADNPLYQYLSFLVKNPDFPNGSEPLSKRMTKNWEAMKTAEADFLCGLERMWLVGLPRQPVLTKSKNEIMKKAFNCLKNAADKNIAVAQYYLGRSYYYTDFFPNTEPHSELLRTNRARTYLEQAARNGHLKAKELLVELELSSNLSKIKLPELLTELNSLCKLNYGRAYFLKAKILEQLKRYTEAKEAYSQATKFNDFRGFRGLALLEEKQKKSESANALWYQFISADLNARKWDIYDPYWPNVYAELNKWKAKAN